MENLKCPFCGGDVLIVVCDDVGNIHDEAYETDPWSGLQYGLYHDVTNANGNCPIAGSKGCGELGVWLYDTREDAAAAWNNQPQKQDVHNGSIIADIVLFNVIFFAGIGLFCWLCYTHPDVALDIGVIFCVIVLFLVIVLVFAVVILVLWNVFKNRKQKSQQTAKNLSKDGGTRP